MVSDLRLERETTDLSKVDVLHLHQFLDGLESVLECDLGVFGDVAQLTDHQSLILWQVARVLIPELKALVQFDLGHHLGGNNRQLQDVGEVLSQLDRVHSFHTAASHLWYLAQRIQVALLALNRYQTHSDSVFLSKLAQTLI